MEIHGGEDVDRLVRTWADPEENKGAIVHGWIRLPNMETSSCSEHLPKPRSPNLTWEPTFLGSRILGTEY